MNESRVISMEPELLKMLAGAAAREAASEIVVELRSEVAEQFESMKNDLKTELKSEFNSYFGDMKPSTHIIQHDRLYRFVRWYDDFTGSLWGKLATGIVIAGCAALGLLWIAGKALGLGG